MVMDERMSRSPLAACWSESRQQGELVGLGIAKVIVPAGSTIVSAPEPAAQSGHVAASLFALMMASRMEHWPSVTSVSAVVVTTIVAASEGSGNARPVAIAAIAARKRAWVNMAGLSGGLTSAPQCAKHLVQHLLRIPEEHAVVVLYRITDCRRRRSPTPCCAS
jgi:hypothetical protein